MKNKLEDLRNHLFAALEGLQDKKNPMELDRAKAIAEVAQVVVNTAKAEVDFYKVTGARPASDFIAPAQALPSPKPKGVTTPAPGHLVHKIEERG